MCKRVSSNGSYDYQLTGIGWTMIDSFYATNEYTVAVNDYFVMYSEGEDGSRKMYFRVKLVSNYIEIMGFLHWDATTHTGTQPHGIANSSWYQPVATNNILWVYGDLDQVSGISKYGTTYYLMLYGWLPESKFDQTITVCPGSITAGSNRVVSFTAVPAAWQVGTILFVSDNVNIERVTITAISGNNVTFAAFVAAYSAGSLFTGERTEYAATGQSSSVDFLIAHNGAKDFACSLESNLENPTSGDALTGLFPQKRMYFVNTTMRAGPLKNILGTVTFTSETTHTVGATGYRYFSSGSRHLLFKEV